MQPAPAFRQRNICRGGFDADEAFEDAAEILPMLRGQSARHVFPHRPSRIFSIRTFPHFSNDAHGFVEKSRTTAAQPAALSRDGKILTGRAESDNIHRFQIGAVQSVHVSVVFHFGQPFFRHADGKRLDLRSPDGYDSRHFSGKRKPADAIEKAAQCQFSAQVESSAVPSCTEFSGAAFIALRTETMFPFTRSAFPPSSSGTGFIFSRSRISLVDSQPFCLPMA